ncbi:MAG: hypothetical protein U0441_04655 [Polyangiaceae bacterium]
MRARLPHLVVAVASVPLFFAACTGSGPGDSTGTVVVGVASKLVPGSVLDSVHVTVKAGGVVAADHTYKSSAKDLSFPIEEPITDLADGEKIEVAVEGSFAGKTLITRNGSTEAVAGKEKLLRLDLTANCLGQAAPNCEAPMTCDNGACDDGHVPASKLPDYTSNWSAATKTVDVCKPKDAGDPVVVIGEGQSDYLPLMDGDVAQIEAGPQGGHHIWMAVRLKNLTQSGSITSLTGHLPELGYDVGPFNVIFTFDPAEGGYCKIYGLRFQLDTEHDINEMLGKTLEITATITDKDKDVGTGKRTVKLSDTILGQ